MAASLLASLAAGCNSSQRFAENPFTNPFTNPFKSEPVATGSLPQRGEEIEAEPLTPPGRVSSAPLAPAASTPVRAAAAPAPVTGGPAGWSAQGGTTITVANGDTPQTLSTRFGVPPAALLAANGIKSGAEMKPGSRIVIPVYNANGKGAPAQSTRTSAASLQTKPVKGPQSAKPAKDTEKAKIASAKEEPKATPAETKPAKTTASSQAAEPKAPEKIASLSAEPQETASVAADSTGFRWPARGRVIAGFGAKGGNEGINIAVPEGTPVKAAEGGTVAYAGSELKGYGNLVLVRHDNGWVSAYANNGELMVKRGEKVKRGQTIAKSGQTGNVSSPQLHFELRKGATPVDPMPHLSGG